MRGIVFDIDNTLTPPRRPLEPEMADVLRALRVPFHLAAGSNLAMVEEQFLEPAYAYGIRRTLDAFVCNGSDRYRCDLGAIDVRFEPRLTECANVNDENLVSSLADEVGHVAMLYALCIHRAQHSDRWHRQAKYNFSKDLGS